MFGANDEHEEMMSREELKALNRLMYQKMLKVLAIGLLVLGYYLYFKG
jgi:hypothetical protein